VSVDYSVRPCASQRLFLSQYVQLARLARRRRRSHFLRARVSRVVSISIIVDMILFRPITI